jgi:FKBP-type peptidyl-prolyl cis-trans isomerase FkpA
MKQILFTLLVLATIGFVSCNKHSNEPDIKQYDQQQIQSYIAANNLTGMQTIPGDTTGIYYQVITLGKGAKVDYPDTISYVYTIRSFDGKYQQTDTVLNHFFGFLGHIVPNGLMLGMRNNVMYKGSKVRLLIPSHLAYGRAGVGSGSNTIANNKIAGNQCLDYTINLIDSQIAYDNLVIQNYQTANNLSGYSQTSDGLWYKIITPGTGAAITDNSSVNANYKTILMNNTVIDSAFATNAYTFSDLGGGGVTGGFVEGLKLTKQGGAVSLLVPSRLAYGTSGATNVPANACMRFEIYNVAVTNY